MDKSERLIKLWSGATDNKSLRKLGVNREEMATMRKVIREKGGKDMPFFYRYAIKKGLL